MKATKVNAGLAESNGRLLLCIWRDSLHVTCGLTACTPGSAPGPTLGNEYGKTLPFTFLVKQCLHDSKRIGTVRMLCTAGFMKLSVVRLSVAHHGTAANPPQRRAAAEDDGTDGRTDAQEFIDPAPHTTRTVSMFLSESCKHCTITNSVHMSITILKSHLYAGHPACAKSHCSSLSVVRSKQRLCSELARFLFLSQEKLHLKHVHSNER